MGKFGKTKVIKTRRMIILKSLAYADDWVRPMDLGGQDSSHHSRDLKQMARLGLVGTRARNSLHYYLSGYPSSFEYRITDAGRAYVKKSQK